MYQYWRIRLLGYCPARRSPLISSFWRWKAIMKAVDWLSRAFVRSSVSLLCSVSSPDTEFCLSFLSFFPFNSCSVSPSLCLIESASVLYVTCDPKHLLVHAIYVTMPHKVISPDFSKDNTGFSSYSLGSPCKSLVKITVLDFFGI